MRCSWPADVSEDGQVVVGLLRGGGTFASSSGYFDWIPNAIPANPDPTSWALAIGGGTDINGGPVGGRPSISSDGRYVGGTAVSPVSGYSEMARLDRNTGVWTTMGGLITGYEQDDDLSNASGISADGQRLVGSSFGAIPEKPGVPRAIQWSAGGGLQAIESIFEDVRTNAFAVSGDGSLVAGVQNHPVGGSRQEYAMIWKDGVAIDWLTHTGDPTAVSGNGEWVVGSYASPTLPGDFDNYPRAHLYPQVTVPEGERIPPRRGTTAVNLVDYAVWRDNLGAPAITLHNDIDGGTVGEAQYQTWKDNFGELGELDPSIEAWRWSEATGRETLGCLNGGCGFGKFGVAVDVNSDGSVILGRDQIRGISGGEGWIWREGIGMTALGDFFESQGIDTGGFGFGLPMAMSADGQTFVGVGYDPVSNQDIGWVLTLPAPAAASTGAVPEPSTVALLIVGGVALVAARRRAK